MCWSDAYLIIDLGDQYVENLHKSITHSSSVTMHVGMVVINTLNPWPCYILFDIYDDPAESYIFYTSQIYDWSFSPDLLFCVFWLWYLIFLGNYPTMIVMVNACFCDIFITHNQTLPCTIHTSSSVGLSECYVA